MNAFENGSPNKQRLKQLTEIVFRTAVGVNT